MEDKIIEIPDGTMAEVANLLYGSLFQPNTSKKSQIILSQLNNAD